MTWAVGSIQQYWQVAFMLGALYFAARDGRASSLLWATALSVLAVFSGAGGVLIFLVVTLFFLFAKRSWLSVSIYAAAGILTVLVYYVFLPVEKQLPIPTSLSFFQRATNSALVGFSFVGGIVPRFKLALIVGIGMTACALFLILRNRKDVRSYGLLIVLLTAFAAASARGQIDFMVGISSKYSMYSILALGMIFSFLAPGLIKRSRYFALGFLVPVLVLYAINGWDTYRNLTDRYLVTESGAFNFPWSLEHARAVYRDSDADGYFPTPFLNPSTYEGLSESKTPALASVERLQLTGRVLKVSGWAVDPKVRSLATAVVLCVDGHGVKVLTYGVSRVDVEEKWRVDRYKTCGFDDSVDLTYLAPGKHLFSIHVVAFRGQEYYATPDVALDVK